MKKEWLSKDVNGVVDWNDSSNSTGFISITIDDAHSSQLEINSISFDMVSSNLK